ncbi:MAG: hypothetical protein E7576_06225 [Ruminococcaceae bacterium]|jgi:hypothetical protein|nr:hypothetical protein [Oscillospiraceae bacterium]
MNLMKKAVAALCLTALVGTAAVIPAAAADDDRTGVALRGTPTIDGQIEDLWAAVPAYPVDRVKDGRDTGITSQFRVMWQEDALYVLVEVNDKDHSFTGGPSVGDGMEIYFDLNNLKSAGFEDDLQAYFAMCADDETYLTYDGSSMGMLNLQEAATVAMTTSDTGYVYEAQILMGPMETKLQVGQTIGFDVQVNDQVSGESERSGAYGWSDDANNAWQGTMLYGDITLTESGEAPAASASASVLTIFGMDYKDCGDNANEQLQYGSEDPTISTSIPLKPLDGATAEGAWFDFDIPTIDTGDVTFTFLYAAKGDRYMDVTFNGETKRVVCPDTGNFQTFSETSVTFAAVPAGTATLRLAAPSDYCDDIKTPNIDFIYVSGPVDASAAPAGDTAGGSSAAELLNKSWDTIFVDYEMMVDGNAADWLAENPVEGPIDALEFRGWTYLSTPIKGFAYTIDDGEAVRSEDFIQDRPDVKAAIAEEAEGFDISIEVDALGVGEHVIKFYAIDANDGLVDTTFEFPFTKEAAPEPSPAPEPEPEPAPEPEPEASAVEEAVENAAENVTEAVENAAEAVSNTAENAAEAVSGAVDSAKSGCGSMIGGSAIVLAAILGSAWMSKRR